MRKDKRQSDPWALLTWLLVITALVITLTADAIVPEPNQGYEDLASRYAAQEEYYRVLDTYGDMIGAVEAARVVYEGAGL